MIISVGSDHCGYNLKMAIIQYLKQLGHTVIDNGGDNSDTVQYFPDIAQKVCKPILEKKAEKGIMFCGSGIGAAIACNKIPGIRAGLIHDTYCAHQAVEHDSVQVMCIGERIVGEWLAQDLVKEFLKAKPDQNDKAAHVVHLLNVMDGIEK